MLRSLTADDLAPIREWMVRVLVVVFLLTGILLFGIQWMFTSTTKADFERSISEIRQTIGLVVAGAAKNEALNATQASEISRQLDAIEKIAESVSGVRSDVKATTSLLANNQVRILEILDALKTRALGKPELEKDEKR